MNGKVCVGRRALSINWPGDYAQITGVRLWVDDENVYEAGDETGFVLEADCPYASQEIANSVLSSVNGYQYKPVVATGAEVSPLSELGDGLIVDGEYTQLAYQKIRFSSGAVSDVSAPGKSEVDHEYKVDGAYTRQVRQKLAQTRSLISKTAEEIRLLVESEVDGLSSSIDVKLDGITQRVDGLDGQYTEVSATLDGLTVTDSSGTTKIKGSSIETGSLTVNAANISGKLTASQIDASNLKVNAANISGTLTIGQLPSSVAETSDIPQYTSELINNSGYQTSTGVTNIINGTVTTDYVNALGITAGSVAADNITSGTIMASNLKMNGLLSLLYLGRTYGYVGASNAGDTNGAVLTDSTQNNYFIATNTGARMSYRNTYQIWVAMNGCNATTEISVGSDRALKSDVSYDMEKYEALFDGLKPSYFRMKREGDGGRYHLGLIAQDVDELREQCGLEQSDVAFLSKTDDGLFGIAYGELISLNIWKTQRLEKRIAELEATVWKT